MSSGSNKKTQDSAGNNQQCLLEILSKSQLNNK